MMLKRMLCLALTIALAIATSAPVCAATVSWRDREVHVAVQGKDLKDVLRDFTASQGLLASIDGAVSGTVTGRFDMPPQRFLDTLASMFGFAWFANGGAIYISSANDLTRQVIQLDYASPSQLRDALRTMGLSDPRFPVTYNTETGTVLLSGPRQYIQTITDIARRLDDRMGNRRSSEVQVFRLKNAWAADHKVQLDGNTLTIAGVATILSNLYHDEHKNTTTDTTGATGRMAHLLSMGDASGSGAPVNPPLPPAAPDLNASIDAWAFGGQHKESGSTGSAGTAEMSVSPQGQHPPDEAGLPVVQADPVTNSVLVRDRPDRLEQYASLIDKIDVRPKVIEIEAHIIEIDTNFLKQIGIDWRAHNSHFDAQTGSGSTAQNDYTGTINPGFGTTTLSDGTTSVNATPVGLSLTAVLGNAGRYLLARVNASTTDSDARVEATPKVATLDNVEAVMDNKTKFYVPVAGYASAELYKIEAGVSLRVLPMSIIENNRTRIKLDVHIDDGQLTGQQVNNIPVVTNSEISTQAIVNEGESLLIAGYSVDSNSNGVASVPGLSKIPLLGALFKNNSDSHSHMERLFLLTPRVLSF